MIALRLIRQKKCRSRQYLRTFSGIVGMTPHDAPNSNAIPVDELVWQDDFRAWVLHPTPALDSHWQAWQRQHPEQAGTLQQAREIVVALRVKNRPITQEDIQEVIDITRQHLDRPTVQVVPLRTYQRTWPVAASVAGLILVGLSIWWFYQPTPPANQHVAVATRPGTVRAQQAERLLHLPDGSTVQLGKNSELTYPGQFAADRREVFLTGTATFDIQRRPEQPFLVYANGSVTRVLGTRFIVQAQTQSGQVLVKVLSGKVSVLAEDEWRRATRQAGYQPQTIIVTPNQQVVFERTSKLMHKALVEQPKPLRDEPVEFNFVKAPVALVLTTLEKAYGIPINFDKETFRNCQITAPLTDESLFEKLDIICETIGARYEVVEAQIIITGKGCS